MSERVPKRIELLTAGTLLTTGNEFPGGKGAIFVTTVGSLNGALQALIGSDWVPVKDSQGVAIVLDAVEMHSFELPACKLRVNGTLTGGSAVVVSF